MSKELAIAQAIEQTDAEIEILNQKLLRLKSGNIEFDDLCPIEVGDEFILYKDGKRCGSGHFKGIYTDGDLSFWINELGESGNRDFLLNGKIHSGKFPYLPL